MVTEEDTLDVVTAPPMPPLPPVPAVAEEATVDDDELLSLELEAVAPPAPVTWVPPVPPEESWVPELEHASAKRGIANARAVDV